MRDLHLPGRSTAMAVNGMVATSHPLSSQAALAVLQAGGNAMDAAVTASAVQCVVEPESTGIGGDCFCLTCPAEGGVVAFNGSGRAPAGLSAGMLRDQGIEELSPHSPHAVTIPGAIDAWDQLLRDHGTCSLGEALQPAIRFARQGFPVSQRVHTDFRFAEDYLRADPDMAEISLVDGAAPAYGSLQRSERLAETLEEIAISGRNAFYTGPIAQDMVDKLQRLGGTHQMTDFAAAKGEYVVPIHTTYRGYQVFECPPNGQGVAALGLLNILSGYQMSGLEPLSAERLHLLIEATRLAYRDRDKLLADPAHSEIPVAAWLSQERAARHRASIGPDAAMEDLPPWDFPEHADTVYISVVDRDRNAVSFINSLFWSFGSGIVAPSSGVVLHNRGLGFSLTAGHPCELAPGKRPLHTIIPGMLMKDDRVVMPFGVMGGHYQACGHAYFLGNLLDHGMDLQEAVDAPRVFPTDTGAVEAERGLGEEARSGLGRLGHTLSEPVKPIGGGQAVWIDWHEGVLRGASDPRKDGLAIGY